MGVNVGAHTRHVFLGSEPREISFSLNATHSFHSNGYEQFFCKRGKCITSAVSAAGKCVAKTCYRGNSLFRFYCFAKGKHIIACVY